MTRVFWIDRCGALCLVVIRLWDVGSARTSAAFGNGMWLHPIGRIASQGPSKRARLRSRESPPPTRSPEDGPSGTLAPMRSPDPILAKITALFDGLDPTDCLTRPVKTSVCLKQTPFPETSIEYRDRLKLRDRINTAVAATKVHSLNRAVRYAVLPSPGCT
jgi:hypothetical protein